MRLGTQRQNTHHWRCCRRLYAFNADSGELRWSEKDLHQNGLLALSIHAESERIATSGQDGTVLIWDANDGKILHSLKLGVSWVEHLAWSDNGQKLAMQLDVMSILSIAMATNNGKQKLSKALSAQSLGQNLMKLPRRATARFPSSTSRNSKKIRSWSGRDR